MSLAQALTILAAPVLARLYGPDAIGLLVLFSSTISVLAVIVCCRFDQAIILPASRYQSANLFSLSLSCAVIVSTVLVPWAFFGQDAIAGWLNSPQLAGYLPLLPAAVLLTGGILALTDWAVRARAFARIAIATVAGTLVSLVLQVVAGAVGFRHGGVLIVGMVIGLLVTVVILAVPVVKQDGPFLRAAVRWRRMQRVAFRYRKFPLITTWTGFLNTGAWHLPHLLLAASFSSRVVGYYSLSNFLIRAPLTMVGQPLAKVFLGRAAAAHHEGGLSDLVLTIFRYLAAMSVFPMLVLALTGREVFSVFLGASWGEAGLYAQLLAPMGLLTFISIPMQAVFNVLERQDEGLKIQVGVFGTRMLALMVGGMLGDARMAILLFSVLGVISYGYMVARVLIVCGIPLRVGARELASRSLEWLPVGAVLLALELFKMPAAVVVGVALFACVAYYVRLISTDDRLRVLALYALRRGNLAEAGAGV